MINATHYSTALIVFLEPHINKLHYLPTVLYVIHYTRCLGGWIATLCVCPRQTHMNIEAKYHRSVLHSEWICQPKRMTNDVCIISIQSNSREDWWVACYANCCYAAVLSKWMRGFLCWLCCLACHKQSRDSFSTLFLCVCVSLSFSLSLSHSLN